MTEQTKKPREVPKRLAALLVAFGDKLTGEEMKNCVQQVEQIYSPSLSWQQERICRWLLDDEELAQFFGLERKDGLEQISNLRRKCESALSELENPRQWRDDYNLRGQLGLIIHNAQNAIERWDKLKTGIQEALKEVPNEEKSEANNTDQT